MEYRRDMANANVDPFIVDWPVEADTLKKGEVCRLGLSDGNDLNFAVSAEGALGTSGHRILGVCNEGITSTLDIDSTATYKASNFGKMIVNPFGVFSGEWSQSTSDDITFASELAFTCGSSKGMPYLGGSWLYIVSGAGIGELCLIEDSSTSSTTCTVVLAHSTLNDGATALSTTGATSNVIIVLGRGQRVIRLGDTDLVQHVDADYDSSPNTQTYGIGVTIVENYMQTSLIRPRVLGKHDERSQASDIGRSGLNSANVRFFSELVFGGLSHVFACSTGITRAS